MTNREFLGRVPLARALTTQVAVAAAIGRGDGGRLLGFECEPVVTLGLRARDADLTADPAAYRARGIDVVRVDRGGQATLHNPGQLIIFPVWSLGRASPRAWVDRLITCTREVAAELGQPLWWREDAPGLYDVRGAKVASIGLRIRRGVSTHGLAINVRNDLAAFGLIRACGHAGQPLAHLNTSSSLEDLFLRWVRRFEMSEPN